MSSPHSSRDRGPLRVYEATQSCHDGAERQLTAELPPQRRATKRKMLFILQFVRWSITLLWINLISFSVEEYNPDWETAVSIWSKLSADCGEPFSAFERSFILLMADQVKLKAGICSDPLLSHVSLFNKFLMCFSSATRPPRPPSCRVIL